MSEKISRRDFLKLASVGAASTAVLFGCGPGFEPPGELKRTSFDQETVVYNGKTVSVNALDFLAMAFYTGIKEKVQRIANGDMSAAARPASYAGAAFPQTDWAVDAAKTAIFINQTDAGDFVSHAIVGRKRVGENPLTGNGGFNQIMNDITSATAYNDHSLLVMGRGDRALWFDNIESVNQNGERARIAVDSKKGKIFQIKTNSPNYIERSFQGEQVAMEIGEINVAAGETEFSPAMSPLSAGFIGFLTNFISRMPADMPKEEKLAKIQYFFSSVKLNSGDVNQLQQLIGASGDIQPIVNVLQRYNLDIPFDDYELAFANSALAGSLNKVFKQGWGVNMQDWDQKIINALPNGQYADMNVVNNLVKERVGLPMATPEVYFVQVKNQNGDLRWYAMGRYSIWENDVDRTAWTPLPDGFAVGQYWFTYGEVSQEMVDNQGIRPFEKVVDGFPFEEIRNTDNNQKKPLQGEFFGGSYSLVEARVVGGEALKYGWDPAESNPKHKINPGFFIEDGNERRFMKLILDDTWGSNLSNLPVLSNRPLPLLGNSPRVIKDVSDEAGDLIRNGHATGSPFLMDDVADFALLANLNDGPDGYLNMDFVNASFSPKAMESLVPPGQFFYGGTDNAILIHSETPDNQPINISVYDDTNGQKKRDILVTHPIIVSPLSVDTFTDGSGYIKIATDGDAKETYLVREEDIFPLGARSTEKLRAIAAAEVIGTIALLYGGYTVIGKVPAGKSLLTGIIKFLGGFFAH